MGGSVDMLSRPLRMCAEKWSQSFVQIGGWEHVVPPISHFNTKIVSIIFVLFVHVAAEDIFSCLCPNSILKTLEGWLTVEPHLSELLRMEGCSYQRGSCTEGNIFRTIMSRKFVFFLVSQIGDLVLCFSTAGIYCTTRRSGVLERRVLCSTKPARLPDIYLIWFLVAETTESDCFIRRQIVAYRKIQSLVFLLSMQSSRQ